MDTLLTGGAVLFLAWQYYDLLKARKVAVAKFIEGRDPGDERAYPGEPPTPVRQLMAGPGCPKCAARNAARKTNGLDPLPGYTYARRTRDDALWCRVCDEAFFPSLAEAA